jgi:hypothetical protein
VAWFDTCSVRSLEETRGLFPWIGLSDNRERQ